MTGPKKIKNILFLILSLIFFSIPFNYSIPINFISLDFNLKINQFLYVIFIVIGTLYLVAKKNFFDFLYYEKIIYIFLILYIGSYITTTNYNSDFSSTLHVIVISILVVIISNINWSKELIQRMFIFFLVSQTFLSFLTIIDYYDLIGISFVNKTNDSNSFFFIPDLKTATGVFRSRTPLVMYLILSCLVSVFFMFTVLKKYKFYFFYMFVVNLYCGFISLSRSFIIVLMCILFVHIVLCYLPKITVSKLSNIKKIIVYSLILIFLLFILTFSILISGIFNFENMPERFGDMKRVWANLFVYENLLNNLFPSNIYDKPWILDYGRIGFHNILGLIIYKTGLIGILLFLYIIFQNFLNLKNTNHKDILYLCGILFISWMLYGMFHSIINITFMWIILALQISILKFEKKEYGNF